MPAQMYAVHFPASRYARMRCWTLSDEQKAFAPGPPPGRMRMSVSGVGGMVVVSGTILMLREHLYRAQSRRSRSSIGRFVVLTLRRSL